MIPFLRLALLFFIYAFLGWCTEVAFAACKEGRFVNRGFLNGPVCRSTASAWWAWRWRCVR